MADLNALTDGGDPDAAAAIGDRLYARLEAPDRVVEVGIGRRSAVARRLTELGVAVTATDVREYPVPAGVDFVVDDVTDPDLAVYRGADAVYAINCPPDLHRPILDVAEAVDAAFAFTTLGGDPPAVDARPETIPGDDGRPGETLFWAHGDPPDGDDG